MINDVVFYLFCVYSPPKVQDREILWEHLRSINLSNFPWIILGDFNQVIQAKDKLSKCSSSKGCAAFNSLLMDQGLFELNSLGGWYTWTNNRKKFDVVWERLDRAFGNHALLDLYPNSSCTTLTLFASDHSPIIVKLLTDSDVRQRLSFKFENLWLKENQCHDIVNYHWRHPLHGSPAFQMVSKLKGISHSLTSWNKIHFGNIPSKIKELEAKLHDI